jgi:hypothetical protein
MLAIFAFGGSPAHARSSARAAASPQSTTPTVLVVGDSVAHMYSPYFAAEAAKHCYSLVTAARPGCPATGVPKIYSTGKPFKHTCWPTVVKEQDAMLAEYRPALVIWWSRYELAPRVGPHGDVLPLGSKQWFQRQEASFDKRVAALTSLGAKLVTVQIEPPGPDLAVRNPGEHYFLVGQTLLHRQDVVDGWNAFLASHNGPTVFSISVKHLVCHNDKIPCDDNLPDGQPARPDGVHYSDSAMRLFAPTIFNNIWSVAGMQSAPPS